MNQANKGAILKPGTEPVRPCRTRSALIEYPSLALVALAVLAQGWSLVAAAPPVTQPDQPIIPPAQAQSRGELALDGDDDEDMVPISRVVPRVKTIPPGQDQARRLPPNYRELGAASDADEHQTEEGFLDESDLPPPIEDPPPVRARRAPVRPVRPRRAVAAPQTARPVGIATADSITPIAEGDPFEAEAGDAPPNPGLGPDLAVADPLYCDPLAAQPLQPDPFAPLDPRNMAPPVAFEDAYDISCPPVDVDDCRNWGPLQKFLFFNKTNGDIGIGHERVMFAPFEIETSQPANNFRVRVSSAFNMQTPDRAEYIWAKIGAGGPALPEKNLNYQQFDAIYEAGGNRFSFITDIPMRNVDPTVNASGAGLGNISLAPKAVIVNGTDWQISSIFRTYLPTGAATRGTSNGLTSLEPGVLVRYRWSPRTFVHGQLKYWIPVSGDPLASGNVFNFGMGVSHVLHETDTFAIIPVLEVLGFNVGGGTATLPSGQITSADTAFANILPGVRFVLGPKGDLGLCELGINGGFCTSNTGWYREQFTVEVRWSW